MTRLTVAVFCLNAFALTTAFGFANDSEATAADTRLADAAESQDWAVVKRLLTEDDAEPSAQPDGMTALHWASYHNEESIAEMLITAGSDANAANRYEVTPLSIACTNGTPSVAAKLLAAGADANKEMPGDVTPIMIAARTGNAELVRLLAMHDAKVDATERKGQTALMWAAAVGNADAARALIEAGADINQTSKAGFTAMMFAARNGHLPIAEVLLASGVDVNAVMRPSGSGNRVPRKGTSALVMAVESGHFELAMFFIEHGADPNDQRGRYTPLHVLSWVRKPNRGEGADGDPSPRGSGNLASLQFVEAIVAAGADVNSRLNSGSGGRAKLNHKGATPFLLAAKTADLPLLKLLVKLGADPSITNVEECTPVIACAGVGVRAVGEEAGTEPEVIETLDYLLELGLDVNAVDKNGETAMHGAAYRNFPGVVQWLAEHGADPEIWNQKNRYGTTPVMIAQGKRPGSFKPSPETVAALRAAMQK